jgi:hypothetical protein
MADFTSDEISTAVSALVQSTVARPYDTLGARRPDVTFTGVQTAAAGIFILYPLAPFYCIYLGTRRLLESITSEITVVGQLVESIGSLGRLVLDVEDLSPLNNAQAALQALSTAVSSGAPADITKLPQYQRYTTNVNAFLAGPASAIKLGGSVVPTPPEARAQIPSLVSQLQAAHEATVAAATLLANSIKDFASVNLSSLVAQGIISNASSVLSQDTAALAALPAAQRLAAVRTPILNLIAAKSVITAFGSFSGPSPFYTVTGTSFPYADANHLATPATLVGTKTGPYVVMPGVSDALAITLDGGGAAINVTVPSSTFASIAGLTVESAPPAYEGGVVDGYLIGNGTHPTGLPVGTPIPSNSRLHFKIDSVGGPTFDITVQLTHVTDGPTITRRSAQNICDDINTELTTLGINADVVATPYFSPAPHYIGSVNITPISGDLAALDLVGGGSLNAVLLGDTVVVASGANAGLWTVTALNSSTEVTASFGTTPVSQTNASVQIGPKDRGVKISCVSARTISQRWKLTVAASTATEQSTLTALGFSLGYNTQCSPTLISDVMSVLSMQTTKAGFSTSLDLTYPSSFSVTTDPTNPYHLQALKFSSTATLTFASGIITLSGFTGLLAAGAAVGDTVVLPGQGSSVWSVLSLTDTTLTASGSVTPTTGSGVSFLLGPTLSAGAWQTLQITSGANKGSFLTDVGAATPIDIQLNLRTPIPHFSDPTTGVGVLGTASLGNELLAISSPTQTTSSSAGVSGTAVAVFWTSFPSVQTGSSPFFFMPKPTAGGVPSAGDLLEFFASNYANPSAICTVTTVDAINGGYVIGVTPDVPDVPSSWTFGQIPPPYVSLRHGHVVDFQSFETALSNWLALAPQQTTLFFQSLNRVINPLLANTNPTASDVGTAKSLILQLAVLLDINDAQQNSASPSSTLESILTNYTVDPVSQIDTLIKTYQAQGADAAIDLLTGGQFSSFFGLTQDGTSYAGQMQAAMRSVAMNDLPVRAVNRSTSVQARNLGTSQSPDYEFSQEDTETGLKPDAPADFSKS